MSTQQRMNRNISLYLNKRNYPNKDNYPYKGVGAETRNTFWYRASTATAGQPMILTKVSLINSD